MIHTLILRHYANGKWDRTEHPAPPEITSGSIRPCDMAFIYKGVAYTYMGNGCPEGYTMFSEVVTLEIVG